MHKGAPCRILYVTHQGRITGAEVSLLNLLRNIDRRRYCPVVVCPEPGLFTQQLDALQIESHIVPMRMLGRALDGRAQPVWAIGYTLYTLAFVPYLVSLLRKWRIELVHANVIVNPLPCLAARFRRIPVVWHIREILDPQGVDPITRRFLPRLVEKLADEIIVVSLAVDTQFRDGNRRVIYNGVDLSAYDHSDGHRIREEFDIDPDDPLVGLVGQLAPHKGHVSFLQAAGLIVKELHNAKFLIVGEDTTREGRFAEQLRKQINESGLDSNVTLAGFRQDMPDIYDAFDVSVLASITPDPLPRVVVESMAASKPVIAFDNGGGVKEMIVDEQTGLLVTCGDVHALSQAIIRLLTTKQLSNRMGNLGREHVQSRFSLDQNVRQITEIYDKLCSTRNKVEQ